MVMGQFCAKGIILLFLLCFSCASNAIISLHDHTTIREIGGQIDVLEDPGGVLNFDQVKNSPLFIPSQHTRPSYGFSSSVYWVRFRIANLSNIPNWILQVRYAPLDFVDFFAPTPGKPGQYTRSHGGDLVATPAGKSKTTYPQFPLLSDSRVRTYYLRIETQSSVILHLKVMTADKLVERSLSEHYFQGAYFGLMTVMALYNLFIFLVIKDRSYLYYSAFILSTGVFQIALQGYAAVHFWPESLWWNNVSNLFAACFSVGFCGKFAQSFIQLHKYHRRLNTLLSWLAAFSFAIGGLSLLLNYQLVVMLISLCGFGVVCFSLAAGIVALRQGSRPAGFYLLAWIVLLVFSAIHILVIFGVLPTHPMLENSIQIGGAVEAILLSMGLADRINTLQKQALQTSQEANKIKDDFMSTITHELLTPINGVKLSLELLKPSLKDTRDIQLLKTASDSSTHLMNLIESMFNFVELRRGSAKLKLKPTDLKWILTSIYDYFDSVNNNAGVHFYLEWDDTLPDLVMADEKKITSIVVELMKNAYAFTPEGYIGISARKVPGSPAGIKISIQDTGRGISSEKLKRIFEAFDQEDNSNLREHGGLGIGLTMINDILKLMHSRLEIESTVNKGTLACFVLPIQESNETLAGNVAPLRNKPAPNTLIQHKVLVVEDNPVNAKLLCKVLENANYIPITASNGLEALDKLDAEKDLKAVLMDCQMPVMDGFHATRIIRRHHIHSNIPVIAITANISSEDHDHCLECGMNDVLTKPVRKHQIEETLVKWLN